MSQYSANNFTDALGTDVIEFISNLKPIKGYSSRDIIKLVNWVEQAKLAPQTKAELFAKAPKIFQTLSACDRLFFLNQDRQKFKVVRDSHDIGSELALALHTWIQEQMRYIYRAYDLSHGLTFSFDTIADAKLSYPFTNAHFAPFSSKAQRGGILFTRSQPWIENEAEHLMTLTQALGTPP